MLFHILNVITAHRPNKVFKKIKEKTKAKHDNIESHPFIVSMIDGSLDHSKYAIYLANLLPIYQIIENEFLTDFINTDIIQSKKIINDIEGYNKFLNNDFFNKDIFINEWLHHLKNKERVLKKSDLYIRWLADMYGGQIIKRNIKFNSKYDFVNLRWSIKTIRQILEEDVTLDNVDKFIEEVNKSYEYHHTLADKLLKL